MVDNSAGNSKESKKPEINVKIFTFFFFVSWHLFIQIWCVCCHSYLLVGRNEYLIVAVTRL